ncbi:MULTISPECIES: hypothetical protein [unclassified Bacillus (in: firmicutes)]|nr:MULTISPECIES: hypothetical protein [unclassified Bacillus (in: firmicutes)]SFI01780.1 hypothetical protein SAMN04488574_101269 [Bacillus sp. 71mf]SFS92110.1 hypothetical protein SAMN04488145_10521 [Bacillus sp. 103mf]
MTNHYVPIDAAHFESRDRATPQEKKSKPQPKQRGHKPKAERKTF